MLQVIEGKLVEVVEFDTMPELPITGLTREEQVYKDAVDALSNFGLSPWGGRLTYAQALTDAIESGIITEPGKYGIRKLPPYNYEIFKIIE